MGKSNEEHFEPYEYSEEELRQEKQRVQARKSAKYGSLPVDSETRTPEEIKSHIQKLASKDVWMGVKYARPEENNTLEIRYHPKLGFFHHFDTVPIDDLDERTTSEEKYDDSVKANLGGDARHLPRGGSPRSNVQWSPRGP